jgi:hypothetical protein
MSEGTDKRWWADFYQAHKDDPDVWGDAVMSHATNRPVNCVRCIKPTPSTTVIRFGLSQHWYVLALCEPHADLIHSDLRMLVRLAEMESPEPITEAAVAERVHTDWRTAPRVQGKVIIPKAQPAVASAAPAAPVATSSVPVVQVPAGGERWRFGHHAYDRMQERDVTVFDALWALEDPEVIRDSYEHAEAQVRVRGDIQVVCNTARWFVITVARKGLEGWRE